MINLFFFLRFLQKFYDVFYVLSIFVYDSFLFCLTFLATKVYQCQQAVSPFQKTKNFLLRLDYVYDRLNVINEFAQRKL